VLLFLILDVYKLKTYSDSHIIESLLSGNDDRVISSLYQDVFPSVKNYIVSNSGDEEEAYDLFQDAMVLLYNQVRKGEFSEKYKIRGFLYTVSRNLWINRTKRLNRNTSLESLNNIEIVEDNVFDNIVSKEKRELVLKVFELLDEKCKEILKCSVFLKMTMEDIMLKMGFSSVNAAKTQNYRCKKMLSEKAMNDASFKELKELYYGE
jgi:RNA polymerase sigma factor (sigma-70 family)